MGKIWMPGGGGGGAKSDETNVTKEYVLAGKTYIGSDTDDEVGTGTMPEKSGTTQSASGSIDNTNKRVQLTIPSTGRYTTTSKLYIAFSTLASLIGVSASKLSPNATILNIKGTYTNDANAENSHILEDKTAYSKGVKRTGTMKNVASIDPAKSLGVNGSFQLVYARMTNGAHISNASSGYPEVSITFSALRSLLGITAAKIKYGETICGATGTWNGYVCPDDHIFYLGANKLNFELGTYLGRPRTGILVNEGGGAYLRLDGGTSVSTWASGQTVNLSGVSKIRLYLRLIDGSNTESFSVRMYYGSTRTDDEGYVYANATTVFSEFTVDLDVSSISGNKYIGFDFLMLNYATVLAVHRVQLIS